jgi:hypothetical protein
MYTLISGLQCIIFYNKANSFYRCFYLRKYKCIFSLLWEILLVGCTMENCTMLIFPTYTIKGQGEDICKKNLKTPKGTKVVPTYTTGATCGAGPAYPSRAPEFTPFFSRV